MKYITSPRDMPKGHHYAIIKYNTHSVYHEGDERSRQHPGHGYPAHYEQVTTMVHMVFDSKEEWETYIQNNYKDRDSMVCMEVAGMAEINIKTVITVK